MNVCSFGAIDIAAFARANGGDTRQRSDRSKSWTDPRQRKTSDALRNASYGRSILIWPALQM